MTAPIIKKAKKAPAIKLDPAAFVAATMKLGYDPRMSQERIEAAKNLVVLQTPPKLIDIFEVDRSFSDDCEVFAEIVSLCLDPNQVNKIDPYGCKWQQMAENLGHRKLKYDLKVRMEFIRALKAELGI